MQALPHAKAALTGVEKLREKLKASQAPKPTTAPPAPTLGADSEKSAKQDLWNNINKQVEGGATQEEAFQRTFVADYKLNADTEHSNFEQSPAPMGFEMDSEYMDAVAAKELAKKTRDERLEEARAFAGSMQNRWDTSVKKNIQTLTGLSTDPRYLEWLATLGLSPQTMADLSAGRESYITNYADDIRREFNNDIVYFQNLKSIKEEAERNYIAKSKAVNEEKRRVMERPTEIDTLKAEGMRINNDIARMERDEYRKEISETPTATPSGTRETLTINERPITLDSIAIPSLSLIDAAARAAGIEVDGALGLTTGAIDSSSFRSFERQAELYATVEGMVAEPGHSVHETGLAMDLFPDHDYIAKMKPIMLDNGWKQPYPVEDAGHFEFVGAKVAGAEVGVGEAELKTLVDRYNLAETPSGKDKVIQEATKLGAFDEFAEKMTDSTVQDPTSQSILAQTGLSIPAFEFLKRGAPALTRMTSAMRIKFMDEAEKWANENNIDISVFQPEFQAYSDVVQIYTKRAAAVNLRGDDILLSLDMLKDITEEAKYKDLRIKNVAKIWVGKEVNDPLAMQYAYNLEDLRSAIAGFFAVQEGRNMTTVEDGINAKSLIKNGLSSGSIGGLIKTIDIVKERTTAISNKAAKQAQDKIWDMFGVKKPTEAEEPATTDSALSLLNEYGSELEDIANEFNLQK